MQLINQEGESKPHFGVRHASWNPHPFQTTIHEFPHPISDPTLKIPILGIPCHTGHFCPKTTPNFKTKCQNLYPISDQTGSNNLRFEKYQNPTLNPPSLPPTSWADQLLPIRLESIQFSYEFQNVVHKYFLCPIQSDLCLVKIKEKITTCIYSTICQQ